MTELTELMEKGVISKVPSGEGNEILFTKMTEASISPHELPGAVHSAVGVEKLCFAVNWQAYGDKIRR